MRGVTTTIRPPQESGPAKEIHKIVGRSVFSDEDFAKAKARWIGAVLAEMPIGARKRVTYRYCVCDVYRDDLKRLIAVGRLLEEEA